MKKIKKEILLFLAAGFIVLSLWAVLKIRNNSIEHKIEGINQEIITLRKKVETQKELYLVKRKNRKELVESIKEETRYGSENDNDYVSIKDLILNSDDYLVIEVNPKTLLHPHLVDEINQILLFYPDRYVFPIWQILIKRKNNLYNLLDSDIKKQFEFNNKESVLNYINDNTITQSDLANFKEGKRIEKEKIPKLSHGNYKLKKMIIDIQYFIKHALLIILSILIFTIIVINFKKIKVYKRMIGIATTVIILILIITNPTLKNFKEFNPYGYKADRQSYCRRSKNFLIFSIYEQGNKKYLGLLKNFFELKK